MGRMRPVVTGCNRPKAARDGGAANHQPWMRYAAGLGGPSLTANA